MNIQNKQEIIRSNSSETNANLNDIYAKNENDLKIYELNTKKKKVTFESKFVNIINIKSYKKYNSNNNYQKDRLNNNSSKKKIVHCTCFIF